MPAPQGQSFVVQASNPRMAGGLEFAQYASLVTRNLVAQGYQPAASPAAASFVVMVDYGVDAGREKIVTRPGLGYGGFGYGGYGGYGRFGYGGFGSPFYPRFGYRSRFYYGWHDPFFDGGFGYPETTSYTVYTSNLDMTINRTADGQRLFEGRAKARSTTDDLTRLVPSLVEAMFTGFPGRSGEEVRITIPEGDRPARISDARR